MTQSGHASIVAVAPVLRGWINVSRATVQMPNGVEVERHLEDHGAGVVVLPYDAERRVALLVSQPRAPVMLEGCASLLEAIAGRLDGAEAIDRARAEAFEEAGVVLGTLEHVARIWSMPSVSTERLDLFLAGYVASDRVGEGGGAADEHENIAVHELPLARLGQAARDRKLDDAKTLILMQALQLRQPHLFV